MRQQKLPAATGEDPSRRKKDTTSCRVINPSWEKQGETTRGLAVDCPSVITSNKVTECRRLACETRPH